MLKTNSFCKQKKLFISRKQLLLLINVNLFFQHRKSHYSQYYRPAVAHNNIRKWKRSSSDSVTVISDKHAAYMHLLHAASQFAFVKCHAADKFAVNMERNLQALYYLYDKVCFVYIWNSFKSVKNTKTMFTCEFVKMLLCIFSYPCIRQCRLFLLFFHPKESALPVLNPIFWCDLKIFFYCMTITKR